MNKQELIKKYKRLEGVWDAPGAETARQIFLQDLEQLDEPQKVVVPQFIADWIKYCKNTFLSLARALMIEEVDFYNYANQEDHSRLIDFFGSGINQETFARAWLDGYEVEKEPKYTVRVKGICGNHETLNREKHSNKWLFSDREENSLYGTHHTRKQLEEAGFGWVFDCPGIEVEEVE